MSRAHLAAGVIGVLAMMSTLAGCGLEGKPPRVWLKNDSDQVVVLELNTSQGGADQAATAEPHTVERSRIAPPDGDCWTNWRIVDQSGKLLKAIDRVCGSDTVTYP